VQRRTLLKAGLVGGGLLLAAGGALRLVGGNTDAAATGAGARRVLGALMPALLAGALPDAPDARAAALDAGLQRTLATIAALPPVLRQELGQLFTLLDSRAGLWLADVRDWTDASPEAVAAALQSWRVHRFALLQTAYHALHDLVLGPWYADQSTWPALGYPGPPAL
jgi:hypothetical protein